MSRAAKYTTAIVVAHLLVNIAHGLSHRELRVGLPLSGSVFVIVVVLALPLVAMGLVWTRKKRFGFILLSLSMFGSFLFGLYNHFLVTSQESCPFAAPRYMGDRLCPHGVWIAHHGGDWSLLGHSFSMDCQRDFEQSRPNLNAPFWEGQGLAS